MSGQISTPGCLPSRRMHEVRIAGAVRRLDLDFGLFHLSRIRQLRQHEHQAGAYGHRPELPARQLRAALELEDVVDRIVVAHGSLANWRSYRAGGLASRRDMLLLPAENRSPAGSVKKRKNDWRRKSVVGSALRLPPFGPGNADGRGRGEGQLAFILKRRFGEHGRISVRPARGGARVAIARLRALSRSPSRFAKILCRALRAPHQHLACLAVGLDLDLQFDRARTRTTTSSPASACPPPRTDARH